MVVVPAKITVQRTSHESDVPNRKHSKPTSKAIEVRHSKMHGHLRDNLKWFSLPTREPEENVGETLRTNSTCHPCFFHALATFNQGTFQSFCRKWRGKCGHNLELAGFLRWSPDIFMKLALFKESTNWWCESTKKNRQKLFPTKTCLEIEAKLQLSEVNPLRPRPGWSPLEQSRMWSWHPTSRQIQNKISICWFVDHLKKFAEASWIYRL